MLLRLLLQRRVLVMVMVVSLLSVHLTRYQYVTRKFAVGEKRKLQNARVKLYYTTFYVCVLCMFAWNFWCGMECEST